MDERGFVNPDQNCRKLKVFRSQKFVMRRKEIQGHRETLKANCDYKTTTQEQVKQ